MATVLAPPPLQSEIIERGQDGKLTGLMTRVFQQWLLSVTTRVQTSATVTKVVTLTAQTASISTTPIVPAGTLASGLYRISWYQRVTTAAAMSSSLTTTISWTDGGASQAFSGAAMTGNTTSTNQSGEILVNVDGATAVSYATTYASNAAAQMVYKLSIVVELVN